MVNRRWIGFGRTWQLRVRFARWILRKLNVSAVFGVVVDFDLDRNVFVLSALRDGGLVSDNTFLVPIVFDTLEAATYRWTE